MSTSRGFQVPTLLATVYMLHYDLKPTLCIDLENSFIPSNMEDPSEKQAKMDEKLERQMEIDDWLPITSSRNANWWHSAFHNVNSMVGAGRGPGAAILLLSWVITLFTLWQMVEVHEMVPGKRFDGYHELGQHALKT